MLTRIPVAKQTLYLGGEDEMWTTKLAIPVGGVSVTLPEIHKNRFDKLGALIGDAAVDQVATESGFVRGPLGPYRGTNESSLMYLLHEDYVFVLGVKELNPTRYEVMFEGAWKKS